MREWKSSRWIVIGQGHGSRQIIGKSCQFSRDAEFRLNIPCIDFERLTSR